MFSLGNSRLSNRLRQPARFLRRSPWAILALAVVVAASTAAVAYARRSGDTAAPVPVIVELFTSEGCSSCPPVDAFLRKLDALQPVKGVQVIGIEEHVDYWNHDGWVDPYSALQWTTRQEEYVAKFKDKSPFTPQIIVDGDKQMITFTPIAMFDAIRTAAQQENVQVSIQPGAADGAHSQQFEIRVTPGPAKPPKADVWLAVTEDGLQADVTGGENKGSMLQHGSVVRSLEKIGAIPGKGGAAFAAAPRVKFKSGWKKPNLHVVVFVQDHKTLQIVGAASAKVSG